MRRMDGNEVFAQWLVLSRVVRHDGLKVAMDRTSAGMTVKIAEKEIQVVVDYVDESTTGLMFFRV